MAGRWAQLAVDAHIAGAIDYSKPVKQFIENAIHDRLELSRCVDGLSLFPCSGSDDGSILYIPLPAANGIRKELFTWEADSTSNKPITESKLDRLKRLNRIK